MRQLRASLQPFQLRIAATAEAVRPCAPPPPLQIAHQFAREHCEQLCWSHSLGRRPPIPEKGKIARIPPARC